MNGELSEDGANDVDVKDVVLGSFFAQSFDGLYQSQYLHDHASIEHVDLPWLER